jgi:hypothetical protein
MSQPPGGNSPRSHGIVMHYVTIKTPGRRHLSGSKHRKVHDSPTTRLRLGSRQKRNPKQRVNRWRREQRREERRDRR